MKRKQYRMYSDKIDSSMNIAICADLHLSDSTSKKKLLALLEILDEIKPTHIVIPGDLYDVCECTIGDKDEIVTRFINEATDIADVFYVKGNIEQRSILLPYGLYYNNNPRFHLLCEDNIDGRYRYINNQGLNISAISLPISFYSLSETEKCKVLLKQYRKYLEKLSKFCGSKNLNILLCHDPIIIKALQMYIQTTGESLNFDLVISGHNHGGVFPKSMKYILASLGVDIEKAYPTYVSGAYQIGSNQMAVVSEGITRFHSSFGSLRHLENFHDGTVENVKIIKKKQDF